MSESTIVGQDVRGVVEHVVVFRVVGPLVNRAMREAIKRSRFDRRKTLRTQKQNYVVAGEAEEVREINENMHFWEQELSDVADDAQF